MAVLDWLQQLLGGGDPEAAGAAATSTAMMPAVNRWMQGIGSDLRQAVPPSTYDPGRSLAQNTLDPRGLEAAMNAALGIGGVSGLGIKAYHGSPYDFERFDPAKIGAGEGAQAYGHGLYFAENPEVAGSYKGPQGLASQNPAINVAHKSMAAGHDPEVSLRAVFPKMSDAEIADAIATAKNPPPGKMYEVDINAEPGQFLNWDKPLSEQSQGVQKAFGGIVDRDLSQETGWAKLTGAEAHRAAVERAGARGGAEAAFREAGIPGIRYLDQGSRVVPGQISINRKIMNDPNVWQAMRDQAKADLAKWESENTTSNYVMFDPSLITILRKYGILPPAVGAGLLGAANQQ